MCVCVCVFVVPWLHRPLVANTSPSGGGKKEKIQVNNKETGRKKCNDCYTWLKRLVHGAGQLIDITKVYT